MVCTHWAGRSVTCIPKVSLHLHSQEDSTPLVSLSDVLGVPNWPPSLKSRLYLKNLDFVLSFPSTLLLLKRQGLGEGRKSLLLKLLHDSLDQDTPKGHFPHQGFSFICFSIISLLGDETKTVAQNFLVYLDQQNAETSAITYR